MNRNQRRRQQAAGAHVTARSRPCVNAAIACESAATNDRGLDDIVGVLSVVNVSPGPDWTPDTPPPEVEFSLYLSVTSDTAGTHALRVDARSPSGGVARILTAEVTITGIPS